jgi:TRAP-type mannitol/chloroaromatic compound transport system permease large subunit
VIEALVAPIVLIAVVLGSILGGIATATEAAAVGAFGATVLAARKTDTRWPWLVLLLACVALVGSVRVLPYALKWLGVALAAAGVAIPVYWVWRAGFLTPVMRRTAQFVTMIFTILIGATFFSLVFRGLGGDDLVHRALSNLPGGVSGAILIVMVAMFLLGFVMDAFEIIFVVVPIVAPALLAMEGVNPVWLGVMMAMNLQTSYMHPPLGPTLFFLRGVAPPEITTKDIYWGIVPFVLIQIVALTVLWFVPALATWLPHKIYGG